MVVTAIREISMRTIAAILMATAIGVGAQEMSIKELRVPVFDAAGLMTRRLIADSARGTNELTKLRNGVVEFFGKDSPPESVATLSFSGEATYRRSAGIVEGDGRATYHSAKGDLSGDGFRYEIPDGHLELNTNVLATIGSTQIAAKRGTADLKQLDQGKEWIIAKALLDGGVEVTGIDTEKYQFDRAETASAHYTGDDEILVLTSPVTCWRGAKRTVTEGAEIRIDLRRKQSGLSKP